MVCFLFVFSLKKNPSDRADLQSLMVRVLFLMIPPVPPPPLLFFWGGGGANVPEEEDGKLN